VRFPDSVIELKLSKEAGVFGLLWSAIPDQHRRMGNNDGEDDNAEPSVDGGRLADTQDARAREDKDGADCLET
jgi:hypothetical protein